jgi:SAM-dependent methyltransferase
VSAQDYYDHNAEAWSRRSLQALDLDALREFASRLPPGAKVLDAGCGAGRDLGWFAEQGFSAEGFDRSLEMVRRASEYTRQWDVRVWQADFALLSLTREGYDGIWANDVLTHLPPPGVQRALQLFFLGLRSGGILFASFEVGEGGREDREDDPSGPVRRLYRYPRPEVASLFRQSGFELLAEGESQRARGRVGFIARRL